MSVKQNAAVGASLCDVYGQASVRIDQLQPTTSGRPELIRGR